jgi:ribosomal protein L32
MPYNNVNTTGATTHAHTHILCVDLVPRGVSHERWRFAKTGSGQTESKLTADRLEAPSDATQRCSRCGSCTLAHHHAHAEARTHARTHRTGVVLHDDLSRCVKVVQAAAKPDSIVPNDSTGGSGLRLACSSEQSNNKRSSILNTGTPTHSFHLVLDLARYGRERATSCARTI